MLELKARGGFDWEEKEYQTESKRNETFGSVIFWKIMIQETWSASQGIIEGATRQGVRQSVSKPADLG